MFTQSKIAVFTLTLGLVASATTAQAANTPLENYTNYFVNQTMERAKQELQNNVRESVINSAQKLNLNGVSTVKTQVTITDIKAKKVQVKKVNKL